VKSLVCYIPGSTGNNTKRLKWPNGTNVWIPLDQSGLWSMVLYRSIFISSLSMDLKRSGKRRSRLVLAIFLLFLRWGPRVRPGGLLPYKVPYTHSVRFTRDKTRCCRLETSDFASRGDCTKRFHSPESQTTSVRRQKVVDFIRGRPASVLRAVSKRVGLGRGLHWTRWGKFARCNRAFTRRLRVFSTESFEQKKRKNAL